MKSRGGGQAVAMRELLVPRVTKNRVGGVPELQIAAVWSVSWRVSPGLAFSLTLVLRASDRNGVAIQRLYAQESLDSSFGCRSSAG